ncbi:MAG: choice-of-anchor L domain-containing protein, partial [Pseudomonadota bacterium]
MMMRRTAYAACAAACFAVPADALVITPTDDPFALANTLFLNTDLIASAPSLSGFSGQAGIYSNTAGVYGLPSQGIVLSTGRVADYGAGPNTETGRTTSFGDEGFEGEGPGFEGEGPIFVEALVEPESNFATPEQTALLQPITGQNDHFDVVQLDIEFFAASAAETGTLFAAVGSEEFPEFVGSGVNDGFGLYVNGQNVAAALPTGGQPGDPLRPINIDNPDFAEIAGT